MLTEVSDTRREARRIHGMAWLAETNDLPVNQELIMTDLRALLSKVSTEVDDRIARLLAQYALRNQQVVRTEPVDASAASTSNIAYNPYVRHAEMLPDPAIPSIPAQIDAHVQDAVITIEVVDNIEATMPAWLQQQPREGWRNGRRRIVQGPGWGSRAPINRSGNRYRATPMCMPQYTHRASPFGMASDQTLINGNYGRPTYADIALRPTKLCPGFGITNQRLWAAIDEVAASSMHLLSIGLYTMVPVVVQEFST